MARALLLGSRFRQRNDAALSGTKPCFWIEQGRSMPSVVTYYSALVLGAACH